MTGIRHQTASGIVFDDAGRVLLVHHNQVGLWLYPGGHLDPDEDPAQAALRETLEETGVPAEVVSGPLFAHPVVTVHPPPYAILEMAVRDAKVGAHHHIDFVYVLRALATDLTARLTEVSRARWIPVADVAALPVPPELPTLITAAAHWAEQHTVRGHPIR